MMMMANINLRLDKKLFNDVYYKYLFDYSYRYNVYYGGAGSGKSVAIAQKLLIKAMNNSRKILVIRKVGATLKDSVFQLFKDTLSKWDMLNYCSVNLSSFSITLPNGSIILCKGLDDNEKIKSITGITDIWIEEATELTQEDFTQLDLRLRAKVNNLEMYLSLNPVSKANWCYKYWFENGTPNNAFILKTTYRDNSFLPDEYITSLEQMKQTNPTYYKIYALGEFASLDKLVFTNWKIDEFDFRNVNGKLLIGLDFGFVTDKTALICSMLDEDNKKIYIFDEYTCIGRTNDEIAKVIQSKGYSKSLIIADCAEQKSIEELRRESIYRIRASVKGADSIIHGIQKLQQYELIVNPVCEETILELQNYSWQKDRSTGEYINKPIDSFNHCMDALRYSLQCVNDNRLRTLDKSILGL
jgi:phage terminase large subunit